MLGAPSSSSSSGFHYRIHHLPPIIQFNFWSLLFQTLTSSVGWHDGTLLFYYLLFVTLSPLHFQYLFSYSYLPYHVSTTHHIPSEEIYRNPGHEEHRFPGEGKSLTPSSHHNNDHLPTSFTYFSAPLSHGVPEVHFLFGPPQDHGSLVHGRTSDQRCLPQELLLRDAYC